MSFFTEQNVPKGFSLKNDSNTQTTYVPVGSQTVTLHGLTGEISASENKEK